MSIAIIAKHAGVSISSVSRVMTKSRPVQPDIEQKVLQAIQDLKLPAPQARRRTKHNADGEAKPKTFAIITLSQQYKAWFSDPVIASLITELSRAAAERHIGLLLAEMLDPETVCPIVRQGRVDGVLALIPSHVGVSSADTLSRHVPVIRVMEVEIGPARIEQVAPDDLGVGLLAAQHLVRQGCKELAFMAFGPDWTATRMRAQGFFHEVDVCAKDSRIGMRAYFTPPPVSVEATYGSFAVCRPDWQQVMKEFVSRRPDGLFVPRDADLVQAYKLLREHGIEPERDIKIVSCDNSNAYLSLLDVRPPSIDLSIRDLAQCAVARLVARIDNPQEPVTRTLITPQLMMPV